MCGRTLPHTDHPQALRAALPLLSHLQPHISELVLTHFTMSNALAEVLTVAVTTEQGWGGVKLSLTELTWPTDTTSTALTAPIPPLHALSFSSGQHRARLCAMTDTVLAQMQRVGVRARELRFVKRCEIELHSTVQQGTQLPFDRIVERGWGSTMGLARLMEQSAYLGHSVPWELTCLLAQLSLSEVSRS